MLAGAGEFWPIICFATNSFAFTKCGNNKNRAGTDLIAITLYTFLFSKFCFYNNPHQPVQNFFTTCLVLSFISLLLLLLL